MRAPLWLIALLILAIVGLSIYSYFTGQLPLGLSGVIRPPGTATPAAVIPAAARAAAGQPLALGAVTIVVQGVQRGQDLSTGGARGPTGSFALLAVGVQNGGRDPLALRPSDLLLLDERGRRFAIDVEASKTASASAKRRAPFEAAVQPGARLETVLAFEVPADAGALTLLATLGYGELELPR